jgi:hypothetical protein
VQKHFWKFLDANGDGTGAKNCAINGAVAATFFRWTAVRPYRVHEIHMFMMDNGTFLAGNLAADTAPTRPLALGVFDDGLASRSSFLAVTGFLKYNRDPDRSGFDQKFYTFGSGENFSAFRYKFNGGRGPIHIPQDWSTCFAVAANLTAITEIYVRVRGEYEY